MILKILNTSWNPQADRYEAIFLIKNTDHIYLFLTKLYEAIQRQE